MKQLFLLSLVGLLSILVAGKSAAGESSAGKSSAGKSSAGKSSAGKSSAGKSIVVSDGKLHDYYHIRLKLQADNYELSIPNRLRTPKYSKDNSYTFSEGGQFEIFVRKEALPKEIDTSRVEQFVILRMPWTQPDIQGASMYIHEKEQLFNELKALKSAPLESLYVAIELNPYVEVSNKKPLQIRLTAPNIFFRQAYGRYINYIGTLKADDQKPE